MCFVKKVAKKVKGAFGFKSQSTKFTSAYDHPVEKDVQEEKDLESDIIAELAKEESTIRPWKRVKSFNQLRGRQNA